MSLGARKRYEITMSPNKHDEHPGPRGFFFLIFLRKGEERAAKRRQLSPLGQGYMTKGLNERIPAIFELLSNHRARVECAVLKCSVKCDVTNISIFNIHMGFAIFRKNKTKSASLPKSTWKGKSLANWV